MLYVSSVSSHIRRRAAPAWCRSTSGSGSTCARRRRPRPRREARSDRRGCSRTRREAILAHLAGHPDLTAYELRRAIGAASHITDLLRAMEARAEVVARTERRPGQGRPVHVWRVAPPGTVPPPRTSEAAEIVARRRERDRRATAARRARLRCGGSRRLPRLRCCAARPALALTRPCSSPSRATPRPKPRPWPSAPACPARAACYERAVRNGERWGIWGGVNFEPAEAR